MRVLLAESTNFTDSPRTVENRVFMATCKRSQENGSFQQYNHDIHVGTIQTVYVYPHCNALH